jgi:hypothetical protein
MLVGKTRVGDYGKTFSPTNFKEAIMPRRNKTKDNLSELPDDDSTIQTEDLAIAQKEIDDCKIALNTPITDEKKTGNC